MTEKQKENLKKEIFNIHEFIRSQNWEAMNIGIYRAECLPEDILYEINDYYAEPSEVTFCEPDILAETIRPAKCKGTENKFETLSLIYLNGQESDLSMLCEVTFKEERIVEAVLKEVHVF